MPRLFVAITLPEEIREAVESLMGGLPDCAWQPVEKAHLTLRFIGEVDPPTFRDIEDCLAEVDGMPMELALKGIGHFPPRGAPRILWVGFAPNEELNRLRRRVDRALANAGVPREARKFTPHVTLGRFRSPPPHGRLGSYLARHALFATPPFSVSSFHLMSSILRPDGSVHTVEASYELLPGHEETWSDHGADAWS